MTKLQCLSKYTDGWESVFKVNSEITNQDKKFKLTYQRMRRPSIRPIGRNTTNHKSLLQLKAKAVVTRQHSSWVKYHGNELLVAGFFAELLYSTDF